MRTGRGIRNRDDVLDVFESPTWLDDPEFHAYRTIVEGVVIEAFESAKECGEEPPRGISTRYIHETLRGLADHRRTQDALDGSHLIEPVGVLPTRWRPRSSVGAKQIARSRKALAAAMSESQNRER